MKSGKWLMLFVVLALVGGTAAALTWLKAHQRLGTPGVKATPMPGSVMTRIDLPEHVLDYTSSNMPESELELGYFPKDTSFARRIYQSPDGSLISGTVILMGADRTSIHQPKYCLPGQGWHIDDERIVEISIGGPQPYPLPVTKWVVSAASQAPDGQPRQLRGLYVFWFVADNEQATSVPQFQYYLFRDLLFTGVLQRWAYISFFSVCTPGQEDATFARMQALISAAAPEFQVAPKAKPTVTEAKP